MAISFKTPCGCLTSSWNKAADNGKFQFRSDTVMELAPLGSDYTDAYDDYPIADGRMTLFNLVDGTLIYNAANANLTGSTSPRAYWPMGYYPHLGDQDTVILQTRVYITHINRYIGIIARVNPGAKQGYFCSLSGNGNGIYKFNNNTPVLIDSIVGSIPRSTWYWVKFSLDGTTLKLKYWADGDSEPVSGGVDGQGYQLQVTDATYTTGKVGVGLSEGYSAWIDDFTAFACGYSADSPLRFCEWDSGQNGTTWADTLRIKHNVAASDSGSIKVRVGYSNTQPSTLSEAECDALLGDLKTVAEAAAGGMSGTGRWRVVAFQYESDGTQQASVAIFDEGQTVTVPDRVAVDVQASVSDVTPTLESTLSVTGSVEATDAANVALTAEVRKKSDDSLVSTLFSNTVDLSAGSNDLPTLCGGSLSWDTTGADPVAYYVAVTVEDGTTDIIQDVVDRLFFEVVPPAAGRVDANLILSDPAPKVGDTITITGNIQSAENLSVNISIKVYKKDGDVLMATLFSGDKDLVIGANDINDLCGVLEWDTTPHAGEAYYIKVELSGIDPPEVEHMYFVSLPAGGKSFGRYKTV
jgi:hypothetical protein